MYYKMQFFMSKKISLTLLLSLSALFTTYESRADVPQFIFPIECKLGETCWTVNYVDMNPNPDAVEDFNCGHRTYEGHKGTDFAVRHLGDIAAGINILAGADGTVLRRRDGETDTIKAPEDLEKIADANKNCGNAVILDHGSGVFSQYCHLKNGSITVKPGQRVKEGDIIGQMGHSGVTEFPHLHFQVMWEGQIMDPFSGNEMSQGCVTKTPPAKPLWHVRTPVAYQAGALFDAGFASDTPDFQAVQRGVASPDMIAPLEKALVFWAAFYGVQKGDQMTLTITAPDGTIFADRANTMDKNRARQYVYTGRTTKNEPLQTGTYRAQVTYKPIGGQPDQTLQRSLIVR